MTCGRDEALTSEGGFRIMKDRKRREMSYDLKE